jgi:hypothetical protein
LHHEQDNAPFDRNESNGFQLYGKEGNSPFAGVASKPLVDRYELTASANDIQPRINPLHSSRFLRRRLNSIPFKDPESSHSPKGFIMLPWQQQKPRKFEPS